MMKRKKNKNFTEEEIKDIVKKAINSVEPPTNEEIEEEFLHHVEFIVSLGSVRNVTRNKNEIFVTLQNNLIYNITVKRME